MGPSCRCTADPSACCCLPHPEGAFFKDRFDVGVSHENGDDPPPAGPAPQREGGRACCVARRQAPPPARSPQPTGRHRRSRRCPRLGRAPPCATPLSLIGQGPLLQPAVQGGVAAVEDFQLVLGTEGLRRAHARAAAWRAAVRCWPDPGRQRRDPPDPPAGPWSALA